MESSILLGVTNIGARLDSVISNGAVQINTSSIDARLDKLISMYSKVNSVVLDTAAVNGGQIKSAVGGELKDVVFWGSARRQNPHLLTMPLNYTLSDAPVTLGAPELRSIPLGASIPAYISADPVLAAGVWKSGSTYYLSDTYNAVTGEYVQRIKSIVFDGSENWVRSIRANDASLFSVSCIPDNTLSKLDGESNSIANQKKILERYCKDHGITAYRHYDEDDGYSGTNFNRPGFQRMLADIKAGRIKRVIVKDMSRFGRDYLQVGMYTDAVFPEFGVHFIAVNDGVDSTRGESEFTAIRNVFNEMYARDTSKKIRATWQSKGKSGEHLTTIPPYGYMKSPEDKKKWIVDEEAAAVVQKIFSLCASGKGPTQIAKWLKQQQILNPTAYCHAKGLPTSNKPTADPYKWTNETVSRILERVDYLGHTVNFKTTKKSYKSKKKIWNDPENWVIFENTQPPIIEESVFLIVQNIRKARRRPTKMGEMGMFSGLLYCAECGGKMYQCRATNFAENQKYFICSTYRKGKDLCTTHSIKNVVLHEIVLRNLREAISYVSEHEAEFIQDAAESDMRDRDAEFVRKRETLAKADTRIAELDRIISRLYEDNVIGKLSDERFIKMSHDYELEQSNLKSMADVLRKDLKQQEQQKTNVKAFIAAVKKYTDLQELDAAVLRAFIDRIEVSHVDKKSRTREITIVYNFIGAFDFTRAIENARNTSKKEQRTA